MLKLQTEILISNNLICLKHARDQEFNVVPNVSVGSAMSRFYFSDFYLSYSSRFFRLICF